MELSILMPALNEAGTVESCVSKAVSFLEENRIDGEVLVIDNGSSDETAKLAERSGARVLREDKKGYGAALKKGLREAKGRYVVLGDADDSYDFREIMPILEKLRDGCDLVMGNRFKGRIEKGAMPFSHRYIGNPVLSAVGRMLYPCKIHDFHCGLRGYDRKRMSELFLESDGMEYASEMIVKARQKKYRIEEVPVNLYRDGRNGRSHLRSIPDGIRHLRLLLRYRPLIYGIAIFLMTLLFCIGSLTLVNMIPQRAIEENIESSADYYVSEELFAYGRDGYNHTMIDNYADCILTDIIYCTDETKSYQSSISATYYRPGLLDVNYSLKKITESGDEGTKADLIDKGGVDYFRYWHGSIVLLRPLFILFSIQGVRIVLGLVTFGLMLLLMCRLWRQGYRECVLILLTGMLAVRVWICGFCIEYIMTWLVLAVLLLAVENHEKQMKTTENNRERKKDDGWYYRLFILSGMMTCYVDFLTTETLTITVPLLLAYLMRYHNSSLRRWKEEFLFMIKSFFVWGVSYVLMFLVKWGLSALLLGKEAFLEAWKEAAFRVSGTVTSDNTNLGEVLGIGEQLSGTIWRNLHTLFGFRDTISNRTVYLVAALVLAVFFAVWYLLRKKNYNKCMTGLLLCLGVVPYVRFLLLRNHSYLHFFFTYRAQMVTVAAMAAVLWVSLKPVKQN